MNGKTDKMRPGTIRKYHAIVNRFNHLYNVERLRYDDCIDRIMSEFYIESRVTVSRIMCTDIPELPPEVDPNQLKLWEEDK